MRFEGHRDWPVQRNLVRTQIKRNAHRSSPASSWPGAFLPGPAGAARAKAAVSTDWYSIWLPVLGAGFSKERHQPNAIGLPHALALAHVAMSTTLVPRTSKRYSGPTAKGEQMLNRVRGTAVSCVLTVLVIGGCSSSGQPQAVGPSSEHTSQPSVTGSPSTEAPTSSPGPAGRTVTFSFTDSAGWTYQGTFQLPMVRISLSKNITSSAPGTAVVIAHVTTSTVALPATFPDTNPGRPNGPTVTPTYYVAEPMPRKLVTGEGNGPGGFSGGACQLGGNDGNFSSYYPFLDEVDCGVGAGQPGSLGSGGGDDSGNEAIINRMIAAIDPESPTFIINFDATANGCNIFVSPSNTVTRSAAFKNECGERKLHVKVS